MQSGSTTTDSPAEEDDAMRYIEYIESTGTQYINTGVAIASGSISYEISASYTVVNANEQDIIGNWTQLSWSSGLTLCGLFDGHIGCHQYGAEHMNLQSDTTPVVGQIYTISGSASAAGQTLTVNGTSYTRSGVTVNSEPFYLFCNGIELNRWAHVRLYSCKIWDGSTLVRDFVPAVDNGTPGLYDRVTDAFYTNSGTGNFLYPKWIMTADGLVNPDMPPIAGTCIAAPYPAQYWRTERGTLTHALLPGYSYEEGAFKYAELLTRISIPDGVESIGAESFRYSGLKKVSLPENCSYSTDSFPASCEVTVRGEYGQLTGPDGREVLDCYGRRLYVRRRSNNG